MIHFCSSTRQKCFHRYVVINVRWKNKMLDFQCSVICFVLPQFSPRSFLQILSTPQPQYAIILTGSLSTQNEGNDDQWLIFCRYWKWSNGGGPMQRQEGIPMMWDLSSVVTLLTTFDKLRFSTINIEEGYLTVREWHGTWFSNFAQFAICSLCIGRSCKLLFLAGNWLWTTVQSRLSPANNILLPLFHTGSTVQENMYTRIQRKYWIVVASNMYCPQTETHCTTHRMSSISSFASCFSAKSISTMADASYPLLPVIASKYVLTVQTIQLCRLWL